MSVETTRQQGFNRPSYRKYVRAKLGRIGVGTEILDRKIRNLRNSPRVKEMTYADVSQELEPHLDDARDILDSIPPLDRKTSPNSWFRLKGRVNFAPELVLAPHVFATNDMDRRSELADGTSGLATEIVEDAMRLHRSDETNQQSRWQLKGVINEYTYLSVMNYPQDGHRIALPGSLLTDTVRKIDSILYSTDTQDQHYRTYVQLKSDMDPRYTELNNTPQRSDVVYVTSNEFGNTWGEAGGLAMSRLLVKEYQGNRHASTRDRQKILAAGKAIEAHILLEQNPFNTLYSHVDSQQQPSA